MPTKPIIEIYRRDTGGVYAESDLGPTEQIAIFAVLIEGWVQMVRDKTEKEIFE
jgi:hypothetical protein